MKTKERDILQNPSLKEMPFTTPDGYFAQLKTRVRISAGRQEPPLWKKASPYIAIAASLVFLIAAAGFFFEKEGLQKKTQEESYVLAEAGSMTEDDIIEYLISTGVEVEELEQY